MQAILFRETCILLNQKNIETEDIKKLLDNIVVKNNKNKDDLKKYS